FEETGQLVDAVGLIDAGDALGMLEISGVDQRALALEARSRLIREEQVGHVLTTAAVDHEVGMRRLDRAQVLEVVDLPEAGVCRFLGAALEHGHGIGSVLPQGGEEGGASVAVLGEGDHGAPNFSVRWWNDISGGRSP